MAPTLPNGSSSKGRKTLTVVAIQPAALLPCPAAWQDYSAAFSVWMWENVGRIEPGFNMKSLFRSRDFHHCPLHRRDGRVAIRDRRISHHAFRYCCFGRYVAQRWRFDSIGAKSRSP